VLQEPDATNYAYDASKWITASYDPFTLQPDEPVTVKFSVSVPPDGTLQGSYRAALAFTTEPKPGEYKGFAVMVNTRAVVVVYVTIQGTEQPAAELQGITAVTGEEGGKRFLVADVVNKGNVYLRLNGELRFVNTKGEVIKRTPLPERVLLREGLVRYELPIPPDLPEDTVLAAIEIQPQGPAGELVLLQLKHHEHGPRRTGFHAVRKRHALCCFAGDYRCSRRRNDRERP